MTQQPDPREVVLAEYDRLVGLYQDLTATVASLIERMVDGEGLQLHSITKRCKSRDSLADKLAKPGKEYAALTDVTDIAAVRITTYFAEDVDRVAEIVEREFVIDATQSTDKRNLVDPDRFGYQSLHYVASISPERLRLVEYSRFSSTKFEIQIRSILQHAWAEIEHDLGYKSAAGVPREIRRRFSRISGLLELADDEFAAIRRELTAYASTVSKEIRDQPQNVGIDKISLREVLSSDTSSVRELSRAVASAAGASLEPITDGLLEEDVVMLKAVNVNTVADLEHIAQAHLKVVREFAKHFLGKSRYPTMHEGVGVMYLAYVLLAERGDKESIRSFGVLLNLVKAGKGELADRILEAYQAATQKV
ncbi:MAG: hypothetical protein M3Z54_06485 [Gemmatimonadota bacterium]|nr:hypothetical protein [Gemmatimonadota bacterium]